MKRPNPIPRAALAIAAWLLSGACAATAPLGPDAFAGIEPEAAFDKERLPPDFVAALGFDAPVPLDRADGIQAGDRVLYRVVARLDGAEREWLLLSELVERAGTITLSGYSTPGGGEPLSVKVQTPYWTCAVRLLDRRTAKVERTTLSLPEAGMRTNLFDAASTLEALIEEGAEMEGLFAERPQETSDVLVLGVGSVVSLFDGWQANETLADLLEQVVGSPPFWTLVRGALTLDRGLTLSTSLEARSEPLAGFGPLENEDSYWVPFQILYAGTVMMSLDLRFTAPSAPVSAGLGLVELRGVHRTDTGRWIRVELIGARRGTGSS